MQLEAIDAISILAIGICYAKAHQARAHELKNKEFEPVIAALEKLKSASSESNTWSPEEEANLQKVKNLHTAACFIPWFSSNSGHLALVGGLVSHLFGPTSFLGVLIGAGLASPRMWARLIFSFLLLMKGLSFGFKAGAALIPIGMVIVFYWFICTLGLNLVLMLILPKLPEGNIVPICGVVLSLIFSVRTFRKARAENLKREADLAAKESHLSETDSDEPTLWEKRTHSK